MEENKKRRRDESRSDEKLDWGTEGATLPQAPLPGVTRQADALHPDYVKITAAPVAAASASPAAATLTDEQILSALASVTHEVPTRLPLGWLKFARAIEREVLAGLATPSSDDVRNAALEEAAIAAEKVQDDYCERQGGKWPELRDDAATGAGDCVSAIRALKSAAAQSVGEKGDHA